MASVAEHVHDLAVQHRIGLSRYSTAVVHKVVAQLNRSEQAIIERLQRTDNESIAGQRLEQLLTEIRSIQAQGWAVIRARVNNTVDELAGVEVDFAAKLVDFGADTARVDIFSPAPPINQVVAAVNARPFQGRFLREWLDGAEEGAARLVRDTIRQGFVEGRTTDEIVRTIRGTKAQQYKNGLLEITRRSAETMVRTALTHTANAAAQETYKALGVVEWRFVATLDARTSLICSKLHGKIFKVGTGPQPPRHPNCRSTSVPMTDPIPGVAPMEFPTYEAWLKKQSVKTQIDVLGPKRAALFRTGGLKLEKFTDNVGKTLNLDQLRARDAAAFEKSGLDLPLKPPLGKPQDEIARFLADPKAQRKLLDKLYGSEASAQGALTYVRRVADLRDWKAQDPDLAAIRHYTSNAYGEINRRMRESGGTLEDRQFSVLASRGVVDLPDEVKEVWRAPAKRADVANRLWERAIVGEDLDIGNQLQSFSRSKGFAAAWSGTDVLLQVRNPRVAAYIDPISVNAGEDEVLFPLGLRYRVAALREEKVNGKTFRVIELEVVDD